MTEQNSLDKFRSKEVEERFKDLIGGVVNEEFENMNTALDPQPVGCSKDGMECRIRFIKKDWERNQRMQAELLADDFRLDDIADDGNDGVKQQQAHAGADVSADKAENRPGQKHRAAADDGENIDQRDQRAD